MRVKVLILQYIMCLMIDLKREQLATLARPRHDYSWAARFFFLSMDLLAGRKTTPAKAKHLEILASIPYREWEAHEYGRLTRWYRRPAVVQQASGIVRWGRIHPSIGDLGENESGRDGGSVAFGSTLPWLMVWTYWLMSRLLAFVSIRRAFLFNAEFENHAEHTYAENPGLETQSVLSPLVKGTYGDAATWADVFRRIGLDERDHRNRSFVYGGKEKYVVRYEGMPEKGV
jgi:hypothetical protein